MSEIPYLQKKMSLETQSDKCYCCLFKEEKLKNKQTHTHKRSSHEEITGHHLIESRASWNTDEIIIERKI